MKNKATLMVFLFIMTAAAIPASAKCRYPSLNIREKEGIGRYLADENGMTLYRFAKDSPGTSTCKGPCAEKWTVYYREKFVKPKVLKKEEFGTIMREDGKRQLTFRGYPVYYFVNDEQPGDTNGQGVNSVWFVVNPDDAELK